MYQRLVNIDVQIVDVLEPHRDASEPVANAEHGVGLGADALVRRRRRMRNQAFDIAQIVRNLMSWSVFWKVKTACLSPFKSNEIICPPAIICLRARSYWAVARVAWIVDAADLGALDEEPGHLASGGVLVLDTDGHGLEPFEASPRVKGLDPGPMHLRRLCASSLISFSGSNTTPAV